MLLCCIKFLMLFIIVRSYCKVKGRIFYYSKSSKSKAAALV